MTGHAGYAENGSDIVCAAVSALALNTVNCIEKFTEEKCLCKTEEKEDAYLSFCIPEIEKGKESHDAALLLNTLANGLKDIRDEYSDYITLTDREV